MPNLITVNGAKVGHIAVWNGLIANIPNGWQICDGTNGTPDLRSKFVRGVATSSTNPGGTGGADSVTLTQCQIPSHTHTVSDSGHTHNARTGGAGSGSCNTRSGGASQATTSTNSTGITVGNTGGGGSHENRPAFYQVIFIYKVV